MAEFEKMIPFIFHFAAGVYGKDGALLKLPVEEQFEIASKSGWSDDPDDPGGATMIDVTIATYTAYRRKHGISLTTKEDLRNITFAEWKEILKTMYWNHWQADRIESQGIANILVDWVWSSGFSTIKNTQRILGVKPDGIVGRETLATINRMDSLQLFHEIAGAREEYCRKCRGAWKYLKGWLRRLHAICPDGSFKF